HRRHPHQPTRHAPPRPLATHQHRLIPRGNAPDHEQLLCPTLNPQQRGSPNAYDDSGGSQQLRFWVDTDDDGDQKLSQNCPELGASTDLRA
ncbi:MAG: hypothetical protein KKB50_12425, partial [Planctomycetes bacterium]|nr:hypothetical protein [Planctomycetota bacterium]